jgi:hypothetical protein
MVRPVTARSSLPVERSSKPDVSAVPDLPTLTQAGRIALRLCVLSMMPLVSRRMTRLHGPVNLLRRAPAKETIESGGETIFAGR